MFPPLCGSGGVLGGLFRQLVVWEEGGGTKDLSPAALAGAGPPWTVPPTGPLGEGQAGQGTGGAQRPPEGVARTLSLLGTMSSGPCPYSGRQADLDLEECRPCWVAKGSLALWRGRRGGGSARELHKDLGMSHSWGGGGREEEVWALVG